MTAHPTIDSVIPITTCKLNTTRGITNIGSHPDNDIVLQRPGIAPFHLMIDHRKRPYRVILLSPEADICINGVRLTGSDPKAVPDLNQVQFAGLALRSQENPSGIPVDTIDIVQSLDVPPALPIPSIGGSTNGGTHPSEQAVNMPGAGTPGAGTLGGNAPGTGRVDLPGLTRTEEVIMLTLADSTLSVDVAQTAAFRLTVINGGPIVASFDISVDGLPGAWVEIVPQKLNLYEGARATIDVCVTPPRSPESEAKIYPVQIIVTSANYPGIYGSINAELTINPFYDFEIGNLSPRNQSVSYVQKSGKIAFPIINKGNSPAKFLISAQDEENGCQFSFPIEGQANLVKQAEITVPAGQTFHLPVQITPLKRHIVRLQTHQYQYSVSTQPTSGTASMRMVAGSITTRPLFGLIHILLAIIILLATAYLVFRPDIIDFKAITRIIRQGEPVSLKWNVSAFTTNLRIPEIAEPILSSQRQVSIVPNNTVSTYTLEASNWLSTLLGMPLLTRSTSILAIPTYPEITTLFVGQKDEIYVGDEVTIKWDTRNAQEVLLTVEGVTTSMKPEEFSGERTVKINSNTLVVLEARNIAGSVTRSEYIMAKQTGLTVMEFNVDTTTVVKGQPVTLTWRVEGEGIESVNISPFKEAMPHKSDPNKPLVYYPDASMEFILSVKLSGGKTVDPILIPVGVLPAAQAPTVTIFKADPQTITGTGQVEVTWSVTGLWDSITLTGSDGTKKTITKSDGFMNLTVSDTTSYLLTASYQGLSSSKDAAVTVVKLKPVKVSIINVAPLNQSTGEKIAISVSVLPLDKNNQPRLPSELGLEAVSGKVTISDGGTSSCEIPDILTGNSCELTLKKINNSLIATYHSDKVYATAKSDPVVYTAIGSDVAAEMTVKNITLTQNTDPLVFKVNQKVTYIFTIYDANNRAAPEGDLTSKIEIKDLSAGKMLTNCTSPVITSTKQLTLECTYAFSSRGDNKSFQLNYVGGNFYNQAYITLYKVAVHDPADPLKTLFEKPINVIPADVIVAVANAPTSPKVVGDSYSFQIRVSNADASADTAAFPDGTFVVYDIADALITNPCVVTSNPALTNGTGYCTFTFKEAGIDNTNDALDWDRTLRVEYRPPTNGNFNAGSTTITVKVQRAPVDFSFNFYKVTNGIPGTNPVTTVEYNETVAVTATALIAGSSTPVADGSVLFYYCNGDPQPSGWPYSPTPGYCYLASNNVWIPLTSGKASVNSTTTFIGNVIYYAIFRPGGMYGIPGGGVDGIPDYLEYTANNENNHRNLVVTKVPVTITIESANLIDGKLVSPINSTIQILVKVASTNQDLLPDIQWHTTIDGGGNIIWVNDPAYIPLSFSINPDPVNVTCIRGSDEAYVRIYDCSIPLNASLRDRGITIASNESFYSQGGSLPQTIDVRSLPSVTLTVNPMNSVYGQDVVFRCSVTNPNGAPAPSGTCTITATSTSPAASFSCQPTALTMPNNACTMPIDAGTYSVNAGYSGDGYFTPLTSSATTITVDKVQTSISGISIPDTRAVNDAMLITFNVNNISSSSGEPPTGQATVYLIRSSTAPVCMNPITLPIADPTGMEDSDTATLVGVGTGTARVAGRANTGTDKYYLVIYYLGTGNFAPSCNASTPAFDIPSP